MIRAALFLKATIPGGAAGDLFAQPVQVEGHTRGAAFVAPYVAIRHVVPPKLLASTPAPAVDASVSASAIPPELTAAWKRRIAAREACAAAFVLSRADDPKHADHPLIAELLAANAEVARLEIAHRYPSPSTALSVRALYSVPDAFTIPETWTAGEKRPRRILYRRPGVTGPADLCTLRRIDGQVMGQWHVWNYGQRVDGGYWEKHGTARPVQEALAWKLEREAEWEQKRADEHARWKAQEAAEQAAAAERAAMLAAPVDLGPDAIAPGTIGDITITHARGGKTAEPGYMLAFPYKAATVAAVKEIPGRAWEPDTKRWFIPYHSTAVLRAVLDGLTKPKKKRSA